MKYTLTDANFPRTSDQRVYHLGLRPGEVANRIITVGSPSRANAIAAFLDTNPKPFVLTSERGFLTITGRYKGVPISIISIGMGSPNMDFFVREARECLSGDMLIVRLGSCGALVDVPVGSVVVPKASVAISRNVDYDFHNTAVNRDPPYRISKPVSADVALHLEVCKALRESRPPGSDATILPGTVNASADSFYSSQGRQTSFPDQNADLIAQLQASTPDLATLEMETFHLYHLAACWGGGNSPSAKSADPPLATGPVKPVASLSKSPASSATSPRLASPDSVIRAAAAQMIFASRTSQGFITPDQVTEVERWTGLGVLNALINMEIPADRLHSETASVWETISESV
ncbi:nucleoside phosphorylase domain-containing protein [Collybia nuda]|uniref:Nucleoside phosphorylase domain-containing protein n=1 Tax=Collybia nuda TaxID=64659 RepID=A0A9P6C9A5_9AGAR|nr:nucleoside phosphorylase domain-containing protein [Collybia nuda]